MRALFTSNNLIGDGLNATPALVQWQKEHPDWEIDVFTLPDHTAVIYSQLGILVTVITHEKDLRRPYDFEFVFDCGESFRVGHIHKIHQVEAYAKMLGVELPNEPGFLKPIFIPRNESLDERMCTPRILVSPFSRSCASRQGKPPNKMIPWRQWPPIIRYLRSFGYPIGILGAPDDRAPRGLELSEEEYFCGLPLNTLALMMQKAKMVFTIDNGMAHLAASQSAPSFVLYPACLALHWIAPWGNPNAAIVQIDPTTIDAISITMTLKKALPKLGLG